MTKQSTYPPPDASQRQRSRPLNGSVAGTSIEWDARMPWGIALAVLGVIISLIAGLAAVTTSDDYNRYSDPVSYSGPIIGGGIGGFLILLGVILIAGAQRY